MKPSELELVKRKLPLSAATLALNRPERVCPAEPERTERVPLERPVPGKAPSSTGPQKRYRIVFVVFARRPLDWDNYRLKDAQDCLITAGFIPNDDYRTLPECVVRTQKADKKEEERTEITIMEL